MKKLFTLILLAFVTTFTYAQENKNRMFVLENNGGFKGFLVERIDSVIFKKMEGDVSVDVQFHDYIEDENGEPTLVVSFKRSEYCSSFKLAVVPKNISDKINGDSQMAYFFESVREQYSQDFDHGELSGFNFEMVPGAEYTIMGMAYDSFGIACTGSKVDFTVPKPALVGDPQVDVSVTDAQPKQLTVLFTPNEDCYDYYFCLFEEGLAEQQYNQFAGMFGFSCMEDMIKQFSEHEYFDQEEYTWTGLAPGKKYEIYVAYRDMEGTYADLKVVPVTTANIGGEGLSVMTIEIGDFGVTEDGQCYQCIKYIPNDQTAAHRDLLVDKSAFDNETWTDESIKEYMMNEKNPDYPPFFEDPNWDQFGIDEAVYNAEPETEYVAVTMGKNAKGEWGEMVKVEFTTPTAPATANVKKMTKTSVMKRMGASKKNVTLPGGKVIYKNLQLTK